MAELKMTEQALTELRRLGVSEGWPWVVRVLSHIAALDGELEESKMATEHWKDLHEMRSLSLKGVDALGAKLTKAEARVKELEEELSNISWRHKSI